MVDTRKQSGKMSSHSGPESSGGVHGFLTPNTSGRMSDRMSNDSRAGSPALNSRVNSNLNTEYDPDCCWSYSVFPKLLNIFEDAGLLKVFETFMERILAEELSQCFAHTLRFDAANDDLEKREIANLVLKRYVRPGADFEVHIDDRLCFFLETSLEGNDTATLCKAMADVQWELATQLIRDSLPRFFLSPEYGDYLTYRPDTPDEKFSRKKLSEFFGELVSGPMQREEILLNKNREFTSKRRRRPEKGNLFRRKN